MKTKKRVINRKTRKSYEKIDAVITHVDFKSREWRNMFDKAIKYSYDPTVNKYDSISQNRFNDNGELKYVLRSIDQNLNFIRNVYLVIDDYMDVPQWITNVKIVRHTDLLPKDCLPTFNSNVIESFLHKIKGISEPFIYFNNDMFVGKPVSLSDLYKDGKSAVIEEKCNEPCKIPTGTPNTHEPAYISAVKNTNSILRRKFNKIGYYTKHVPIIISPRVMKQIWREYPDKLSQMLKYKFRSIYDISIPILYSYFALYTNRAFIQTKLSLLDNKLLNNTNTLEHFINIQELDNTDSDFKYKMKTFLEKHFPNKCIYEK